MKPRARKWRIPPATSSPVNVNKNSWTELHITFKLEKPFPDGWLACVTCSQLDAEFRLDMFRLYEGEYVRFK